MLGMHRRERGEVFDSDGFYRTDDLCRITNDGFLYFEGRRSEMIKTSGANVAPEEVERLILEDDSIQEAFVLGVPDVDLGEMLVAAIVVPDGQQVDQDVLRARLRTNLSSYKVPRRFFHLTPDEVPRTPSAKVRRPELRELLMARIAEAGSSPGAA